MSRGIGSAKPPRSSRRARARSLTSCASCARSFAFPSSKSPKRTPHRPLGPRFCCVSALHADSLKGSRLTHCASHPDMLRSVLVAARGSPSTAASPQSPKVQGSRGGTACELLHTLAAAAAAASPRPEPRCPSPKHLRQGLVLTAHCCSQLDSLHKTLLANEPGMPSVALARFSMHSLVTTLEAR